LDALLEVELAEIVVLLAIMLDVSNNESSGLLFPSSSSRESGARVHAGASDVSVFVPVLVVVVSKPRAGPQRV
jgi:hypothetical protein